MSIYQLLEEEVMATRPGFYIDEGKVQMRNANFEWAGGFAVSQKQKNVKRLHSALGKSCLEISTKSLNPLGYKLSAFNLKLKGFTLENIFCFGVCYKFITHFII